MGSREANMRTCIVSYAAMTFQPRFWQRAVRIWENTRSSSAMRTRMDRSPFLGRNR